MRGMIAILVVGLMAVPATAAPIVLQGSYVFKGRVEPITRRSVISVDTRRPDAQARLNELRARGAQCQSAPAGVVRCMLYGRAGDVSPLSIQKAQRKYQGFRVEMAAHRTPPSLLSEGEDVRQWQVNQAGAWNLANFDSYIYYERRSGDGKFVLPGLTDGLWINVNEPHRLRVYDEVIFQDGPGVVHHDAIEAILER